MQVSDNKYTFGKKKKKKRKKRRKKGRKNKYTFGFTESNFCPSARPLNKLEQRNIDKR